MTCKEAFAKALDEDLSPTNGEHSFTPCKDAFASALGELGYAEDANPFKSAVGKIKGMFGKANANQPGGMTPGMASPYANFIPNGMNKTLAQHQAEGCEAQSPESCPYNKGIAENIAQNKGVDMNTAMKMAIGYHNGTNVNPNAAQGGVNPPQTQVPIDDVNQVVDGVIKGSLNVDSLMTGEPIEEKEVVTKAGSIYVNSKFSEMAVKVLNEKAIAGDKRAQAALEGLLKFQEAETGEKTSGEPADKGEELHVNVGSGEENRPTPPQETSSGEANGNEKPVSSGKPKEYNVDGKKYVDVSELPLWKAISESWKAGWNGKDIITSRMKASEKWAKVTGSKAREALRNGIASSWGAELLDKYDNVESLNLSENAKRELQLLREEVAEANTVAKKRMFLKHLNEWEEKYASKPKDEETEYSVDNDFIEKTEKKYAGATPKTDIYEEVSKDETDTAFMDEKKAQIEKRLKDAGIDAEITKAINGSSVVQFEIKRADDNTSVALEKALKDMQNDIGVKITYEPDTTSGRERMGTIRINNPKVRDAGLRRLLEDEEATNAAKKMAAPFLAGETAEGKALWVDLSEHGFMGGDSGSGKSERVRSGLAGAYHIKTPNQLQVLINAHANSADYEHLEGDPHTASLAKSVEEVEKNLKNAAAEWKRRQKIFAESGCKNLKDYNKKMAEVGTPEKQLPQILVITDEVTNLLSQRKDLEDVIRDIVTNGRKFGVSHFGITQDMRATNMSTDIKGAQRLGVHSENKKASEMVFDVHSNEINNIETKGGLLAKVNGNIIRLRGTYAGDENLQRLKEYNIKTYQEGNPTPSPEGGTNPSDGGESNSNGSSESEAENNSQQSGSEEANVGEESDTGENDEEGGEKSISGDPFDDLVSEEIKGKFEQEQIEKRTAEAEEWRNQKLDEIKNSNLSWDDRKKAVDAAKKEYAARIEAAKKGQAYEPPSEKPNEGENGDDKPKELTESQLKIKSEFDADKDAELKSIAKLPHRERVQARDRIEKKYAQIEKDIRDGKSETEILDRIEKEEQEEADKKAAAEKAKADAEQAKSEKEKAEKEKAAAEEAKKAEITKAREKSKADYTSLKDKAIGDLKKQIGKNGYTESDYQKDKLALEEKHAKRLKDLDDGKSEKDIYDRETAEQAEIDKKNESLRKTVRTEWKGNPVAGAKAHIGRGKFVPLDPKEEKEYSSLIPKGWKLDGDKTIYGVAYARNPVDGSYGFINPKTKTFTKIVDTSHPKYKGIDSKEANEAKVALKNATAKNHAELEKAYNNIAYGHDEALPMRAFLLSGIAAYLSSAGE